ncbi:hypothetical protein THAOC_30284 [Thalassiosira oceanica]|uniref:Multidrug and toxic compound extrusion protein n=1 Tax=Thalassiosira oceanica TaxID=159749 RepID=K0RAL9_THAOC|nr:hypothetical protein THAOC_30284 [Thalassiosira oceanica]|eukprot:EJK50683.1 hypothetical protein THAOC_30284 [Thalassiosira oceanica]
MGGDEEKHTSVSDTMTIDRETMISYGSVTPQHTDLEERPLTMEGEKSNPRRYFSKNKLLKDEAEKMTLLAIPVTFTYLLEMLPGVACVVLVGRVENIHEPGDQKVQLDAAALATMMMNVRELRNSLEFRSDTTAPRPAGGGLSMCGAIYEDPDPRHTIAVSLRDNTKGVSGKKRGHAHAHNCGSEPSGQLLLSVRLGMSGDRVESAAAGKCEGDEKMSDGVEFLQELWKGFVLRDAISWDALREFFTLGVPGMLQVMFEWCAFEVVALFCGWFPDDEAVVGKQTFGNSERTIRAHSPCPKQAIGASFICMNISSISYMLYLGVSVAGSVRIGNALGANDPHRAELATHLSLAAGFFLAFVNMAIILWSRDTLPYLFTKDPDIVEKSKDLFVVAAVFQLPDAINGVFQGVFRGSGDQVIAALWNFVAYYIVGLPLGYVLGLRLGIGVEGLWEGMVS